MFDGGLSLVACFAMLNALRSAQICGLSPQTFTMGWRPYISFGLLVGLIACPGAALACGYSGWSVHLVDQGI